ncbi:MAG: biotin synthase BioB [Ichthyobacteriaceae bacterium]|nr:biotin synthase BioB [Ichthyobacteriaceae bacterium]
MINKYIQEAYKILDGKQLERELVEQLMDLKGEDILDLMSLANKIKKKFAVESHVCTIMNVKSGMCKEDCKFCSQSMHNNSDIERYALSSTSDMVAQAKEANKADIASFGLVTSGTGYKRVNPEFKKIVSSIEKIKEEVPHGKVCAAIGLLSDETAKVLSEVGIANYNINLQTSVDAYGDLVSTTHSSADRIETIKHLKKYGSKVCSGGIIGLGETMKQRVDMAFTLKELDVDVIPLNVLVPMQGTPLENQEPTPVSEIAKTFALFRLINPTKVIKFAAGRETVMKDYQGLLMTAGANGYLTGGYLTTRGRDAQDDAKFEKELAMF